MKKDDFQKLLIRVSEMTTTNIAIEMSQKIDAVNELEQQLANAKARIVKLEKARERRFIPPKMGGDD